MKINCKQKLRGSFNEQNDLMRHIFENDNKITINTIEISKDI